MMGFASCDPAATAPEKASEAKKESPLMVNMTSDPMEDPHSILMGLHLAQNVMKQGMPATVFLNVHGVKLLLPEAEELSFQDENLRSVLSAILEDGGQVLVCPHCMEAHAVTEEMLPEGVIVSEPSIMMEALRTHPTVFSY